MLLKINMKSYGICFNYAWLQAGGGQHSCTERQVDTPLVGRNNVEYKPDLCYAMQKQ